MCIIKINIIQLLIILIDIVYSNSQPTVTPSEGIPLQTLFSLITTQPNTLVFLYHTWSNMVEDIQQKNYKNLNWNGILVLDASTPQTYNVYLPDINQDSAILAFINYDELTDTYLNFKTMIKFQHFIGEVNLWSKINEVWNNQMDQLLPISLSLFNRQINFNCAEQQCQNSGKCQDGKCVCNQGFYFDDCSGTLTDKSQKIELNTKILTYFLDQPQFDDESYYLVVFSSLIKSITLNNNTKIEINKKQLYEHTNKLQDIYLNKIEQISQKNSHLYNSFSQKNSHLYNSFSLFLQSFNHIPYYITALLSDFEVDYPNNEDSKELINYSKKLITKFNTIMTQFQKQLRYGLPSVIKTESVKIITQFGSQNTIFKQLETKFINFTNEFVHETSALVFETQLIRENDLQGLIAIQFTFWSSNPVCYTNSSLYHSAQFPAFQITMHDMSDKTIYKDLWFEVWFNANAINKKVKYRDEYNGNYICVVMHQKGFYQQSCKTYWISVYYVKCVCYLDEIIGDYTRLLAESEFVFDDSIILTVIDDYNYKIMPRPESLPILLSTYYILIIASLLSILWFILSLWGNILDNQNEKKFRRQKAAEFAQRQGTHLFGTNKNSQSMTPLARRSSFQHQIVEQKQLQSENEKRDIKMQNEVTEGVKIVVQKHNQNKNLRIVVPEQNIPRDVIPDDFLTEQDKNQIKDEQRQKEVEEQIEDLSKIIYHPVVGAIIKYKYAFTRPYRFTLLFERYFAGLLIAGISSTFQFYGYSVYQLIIPPSLSMIIFRVFEIICEKIIKKIQDYDQVKLYRLITGLILFSINAAFWYSLILLIYYVDEIFTLTWIIFYFIAFAIDIFILDIIGICMKLQYKKSMKSTKQTDKFKERPLPMHLITTIHDKQQEKDLEVEDIEEEKNEDQEDDDDDDDDEESNK